MLRQQHVGVARLVLDRQSSVPYQDADSNSGAYIWMHA